VDRVIGWRIDLHPASKHKPGQARKSSQPGWVARPAPRRRPERWPRKATDRSMPATSDNFTPADEPLCLYHQVRRRHSSKQTWPSPTGLRHNCAHPPALTCRAIFCPASGWIHNWRNIPIARNDQGSKRVNACFRHPRPDGSARLPC
jgi:hypothetical protein